MSRHAVWLALLCLALLLAAPYIGVVRLDLRAPFADGEAAFIFWQLRLPRVLLAFLAGAILALAGFISQTLFRNTLATPDTLGVASGAACGAVLAIKLGWEITLLGLSSLALFGFVGAALTILVILLIARTAGGQSSYTLLMAGVSVNFFFAACIVLLQYLYDFANTHSILRWLMGGVTVAGYREVLTLAPVLLAFILYTRFSRHALLLTAGGEDYAAVRGLDVRRFRAVAFVVISAAVGITVTLVGPIGFISLIVPHIARLTARRRFIAAAWVSLWLGGTLLVVCDALARVVVAPAEIPVGIITSFLGAPFFLIILLRQLRHHH